MLGKADPTKAATFGKQLDGASSLPVMQLVIQEMQQSQQQQQGYPQGFGSMPAATPGMFGGEEGEGDDGSGSGLGGL